MEKDPRAEPQFGERVPFVVVAGAPGATRNERSIPPEDLLCNSYLRLDAEYYIERSLIKPLARILSLVGVDVRLWYSQMPKIRKIMRVEAAAKKQTLESYMQSAACLVCKGKLDIRGSCMSLPYLVLLHVMSNFFFFCYLPSNMHLLHGKSRCVAVRAAVAAAQGGEEGRGAACDMSVVREPGAAGGHRV